MIDSFEIPVTFNGIQISFHAKLIPSGYSHKIQVDVDEQQMIFEPDEEGQYRVVMDPATFNDFANINIPLLQEIAGVLNNVREVS